ncbi:MAG TPA: histidinol-phosphate transaminase [Gemmatales bacterium]|nr:histidinol-phosphate transaminase [Gemmatales bacterium]HMP57884.1 histidinol-phosphate transaminase [Gemmatales bacterium]
MTASALNFIRTAVRKMSGYTPGEQPQEQGIIKLNTNENPYPPSPRVIEAIKEALVGDRLRKYPEPTGRHFRLTAARVLGVDPEGILVGNGSDELLTILVRALVPDGGTLAAPTPSYLLYATLAAIQGARLAAVPFSSDWRLDPRTVPLAAHLTIIPNPNSPSGTLIPPEELASWPTPLVMDEAYVDFASANGLGLLSRSPRLIVTRSMSKSYGLAGMRFGFAVADPRVIHELLKVKDSYNCDALSQVAAAAALEDQAYFQATRQRILATRARLESLLMELGFEVTPSQANFVWSQHPARPAWSIFEGLRERRILVRLMDYGGFGSGLRISVGTEEETEALVAVLRELV